MYTQLHNLIGQKITHDSQFYVVIEVIDDGPFLVFQRQGNESQNTKANNAHKQIQRDQHGNAKRKSTPTLTINCLNEFKTDLHPALKELLNQQGKNQPEKNQPEQSQQEKNQQEQNILLKQLISNSI